MPNITKFGGTPSLRKNGVNTLFLNNFNSSVLDLNMVKSNVFSGNLTLDSSKTIGGYSTTKLERPTVLFKFPQNKSQWTIEYYVYPTSYSGSYLWFHLLNSSGTALLVLNQSGANVYTEWTGTGGGYVFDNPANNTAHHVAVTYDNGTIKLYWNGTLRNTFSQTIDTNGAMLYFSAAQAASTNIFKLRVSSIVRYSSNFTPSSTLLTVD